MGTQKTTTSTGRIGNVQPLPDSLPSSVLKPSIVTAALPVSTPVSAVTQTAEITGMPLSRTANLPPLNLTGVATVGVPGQAVPTGYRGSGNLLLTPSTTIPVPAVSNAGEPVTTNNTPATPASPTNTPADPQPNIPVPVTTPTPISTPAAPTQTGFSTPTAPNVSPSASPVNPTTNTTASDPLGQVFGLIGGIIGGILGNQMSSPADPTPVAPATNPVNTPGTPETPAQSTMSVQPSATTTAATAATDTGYEKMSIYLAIAGIAVMVLLSMKGKK